MVERTLIVFKPDSVERGLVGEILNRFEKIGLRVLASKTAGFSVVCSMGEIIAINL